jgi:hypothetical protein
VADPLTRPTTRYTSDPRTVAAPHVSDLLPPSLSLTTTQAPRVNGTLFPNRHRPRPTPVSRLAIGNPGPLHPDKPPKPIIGWLLSLPLLRAPFGARPPIRAKAPRLPLPLPSLDVTARYHSSPRGQEPWTKPTSPTIRLQGAPPAPAPPPYLGSCARELLAMRCAVHCRAMCQASLNRLSAPVELYAYLRDAQTNCPSLSPPVSASGK